MIARPLSAIVGAGRLCAATGLGGLVPVVLIVPLTGAFTFAFRSMAGG